MGLKMISQTVLFVIASQGYQVLEYTVPKKILENAGITVVTVSDKAGLAVANDKSTTSVDLVINNIVIDQYAGIIFIGGPGALDHLDNKISYTLLKQANDKKLLIGAICVSPRILAHSGILDGKKATGWDGDNQLGPLYKKHNITYLKKNVVTDGNIITASGPQAADAFGRAILQYLKTHQ